MAPDDLILDAELAQVLAQAFQRAQVEGRESEFERTIIEAFERALKAGAGALAEELKRTAPTMLSEHRELRDDFEARLRERWGPALDLYEAILVVAQEAGDRFRTQHAGRAARDADLVFWVLVRLHARACQTASEVLVLLGGGYATAAMARWRTIHEIAVVMYLIRDHGQELARCYLDHEAVDTAKDAKEYQENAPQLGYEPLAPAEYTHILAKRDAILKRYGRAFDAPYGWAAHILGPDNINFKRLEKVAKLDHMRPHYSLASQGVHGNPKGILFQLGQIGPQRVLLAGASNAGLADPGHATLIALLQCTVTFLNIEPDEFTVMTMQAMARLVDEAGEMFLRCHQELLQDERELQARANEGNDREDHGDTNAD